MNSKTYATGLIVAFLQLASCMQLTQASNQGTQSSSIPTPAQASGQVAQVSPNPSAPSEFKKQTKIRIGEHALTAEVALTPAEQSQGLMNRPQMADDRGMLFVFAEPKVANFWMKNTLIPLSIAFIDKDYAIVSIQEMQPLSEEIHTSGKPVKYALEANKGWFAKRGIRQGSKVIIEGEAAFFSTSTTLSNREP